jgi:hypothetical protein
MLTEEQLKTYDIILLIDKSSSMTTADVKGRERWDAIKEQTAAWAREAHKWDQDGITVGFFNNKFSVHENVTPAKVDDIFKEHKPSNSTETHEVIEHVLNAYLNSRKKPILVFVVTDGASSDNKKLATVIAKATHKMTKDEEIGIQFVQIGQDPDAAAMLKFLDDELMAKFGAKFDIVDTTTFEEAIEMPFLELCSKTLTD